jgi:hypothetical protein
MSYFQVMSHWEKYSRLCAGKLPVTSPLLAFCFLATARQAAQLSHAPYIQPQKTPGRTEPAGCVLKPGAKINPPFFLEVVFLKYFAIVI